jgi:GMP synthase (glutamine-hydrolysing)
MRPVAIIQHDRLDPPSTIGRHLNAVGCPWQLIDVGSGAPVPETMQAFSALILMGGDMHVHQEAQFPFLRLERVLLTRLLAEQFPMLGICLGAQLLAATAGARVYQRSYPEIGWIEVETQAHDPLLIGIDSPFITMQWHDYSFELPPGAVRVAARDDGEQVFRAGLCAWGVQFHPEVDPELAEKWVRSDEARLRDLMPGWPDEIRADTQVHVRDYASFCGLLIDNFLVASGVMAGSS